LAAVTLLAIVVSAPLPCTIERRPSGRGDNLA
jgi:hypothetical protein